MIFTLNDIVIAFYFSLIMTPSRRKSQFCNSGTHSSNTASFLFLTKKKRNKVRP